MNQITHLQTAEEEGRSVTLTPSELTELNAEIERLAMLPWKRGYIAPSMSAKAAIVANTAIMRMMRCDR